MQKWTGDKFNVSNVAEHVKPRGRGNSAKAEKAELENDNFYWARRCTLWAASDLYGFGSYQYNQVAAAWSAVGGY